MTPLPAAWVRTASPLIANRLPLWDAAASQRLGVWDRISITPEETRVCLVVLFAHALVFLVVMQRVETLRDVRRLLTWIALAAAGCAAIGLLQYATGTREFLGVYAHPFRSAADAVKGPFSNQNHLAHFLALGVGPLAYLLTCPVVRRQDQWRRWAAWCGLALVALAGVLSFSRGGWVALTLAFLISIIAYSQTQGWSWKLPLGLLAMIGLVAVAASSGNADGLLQRWATLEDSQSFAELSARRDALWKAHAKTATEVWLAGAGAGSHRYLYPTFMRNPFGVDFSHAENGYLQVLLETGVGGLGLLLSGWILVATWIVRAWKQGDAKIRSAVIAVAAGLVVSVVHSLADFVWYIPACMSVTIVLAALARRLSQLAVESEATATQAPRAARPAGDSVNWGWILAAIAFVLMQAAAVRQSWGPALAQREWDAYFAISRSHRTDPQPSDDSLQRMAQPLRRSLALDPYNARAHGAWRRS